MIFSTFSNRVGYFPEKFNEVPEFNDLFVDPSYFYVTEFENAVLSDLFY